MTETVYTTVPRVNSFAMSKDYLSFKYPYVLPVASKLRDKRFLASSEHSAELGIEITPQKSVYRKYFWPIFIHLSIFVTYSCGLIVASSLLFGEGASLAILYGKWTYGEERAFGVLWKQISLLNFK
jgi:hypothetical protein